MSGIENCWNHVVKNPRKATLIGLGALAAAAFLGYASSNPEANQESAPHFSAKEKMPDYKAFLRQDAPLR